jgi:hypothetical protein
MMIKCQLKLVLESCSLVAAFTEFVTTHKSEDGHFGLFNVRSAKLWRHVNAKKTGHHHNTTMTRIRLVSIINWVHINVRLFVVVVHRSIVPRAAGIRSHYHPVKE